MTAEKALLFFVIIAVASYLYGNVNNAVIISKFLGRDVRKEGSGNPGTLNMSRTFGIKIGALVLLLDILKGVVPTLVASLVFGNAVFEGSTLGVGECARYIAGFFVVLGHVFPVIYKFKGGKGIASTIGFMAVCNWWFTLICGVLAIAFILLTKLGAIGSFIATVPPIIYNFVVILVSYGQMVVPALYFFIAAEVCLVLTFFLIIYAHRTNIKRLVNGNENKTDWSGMIKKIFSKKKENEVQSETEHNSVDTAADTAGNTAAVNNATDNTADTAADTAVTTDDTTKKQ